MKWPPLPKNVLGILGPIPVTRVRGLKDPSGRRLGGQWHEERRVIEIEMKVTRATAWFYLFHEKAHADFDEYGCTFPEMRDHHGDNPLEERACNAVATSRIRDLRAALSRKSP